MSHIGILVTNRKAETITENRVQRKLESSKEWSVAGPLNRNIVSLKELLRLSKETTFQVLGSLVKSHKGPAQASGSCKQLLMRTLSEQLSFLEEILQPGELPVSLAENSKATTFMNHHSCWGGLSGDTTILKSSQLL